MTLTTDSNGRLPTEELTSDSSSQAKAGMLSMVGSEIADPVRGMLDTIQLLLSTELSEEQRRCVEVLRSSGATLLDTINDILDLSRIESGEFGEFRLQAIEFDLHTAVHEAVKEFEKSTLARGRTVTCLIHQEVPTRVKGDPGRLRDVIRRFLTAAARSPDSVRSLLRVLHTASEPDAIDVRFELAEAEDDSSIETLQGEVRGLSHPATKASAFSRSGELGSEILNRLAALMGGQFGVTHGPENRRTEWFSLRLGKPGERSAELPAPRPNLRGLYVLAVLDQEETRNNLVAYTLSWGMTCDVASSAEDALEMMQTAACEGRAYDLALIDTQMPGTSALELARAMQGDQSLSGVRPIVLTALGMRGETEEFRRAGVAGYLSRPVNASDLYNCLATVMSIPVPERSAETRSPRLLVTSHKLKERKASRRTHVLVVEDNTVNQMVAVRMLEKLGVRSDIAITGKGAVEACRRNRYDLILMDCAMPEMDGYEATRAIRNLERDLRSAPTPILAVTANAMRDDREKCLAAGMDDYLAKPYTFDQFHRAVARWISVEPGHESATSASAPHEAGAIDASFIEDLRSHPADGLTEFLTQLRAQFLRDAEDRLAAINSAVALGDAVGLQTAAHGLKGSSGVVGAKSMAMMCAELEERAYTGRMGEVVKLAGHLQREFGRVREELDAKFTV